MIEFQNPDISIVRQCKLFKISCTSVYYKPKTEIQHPKLGMGVGHQLSSYGKRIYVSCSHNGLVQP
jgi:hypothetical protein